MLLRQNKSKLLVKVSCKVASANTWTKTGLNHVVKAMFFPGILLKKMQKP
jgi:hypothetical protein